MFTLCDGTPPLLPATALPAGNPSEIEMAQTILEAHRVPSEMNDANHALFQNVVDAFEKGLGKP